MNRRLILAIPLVLLCAAVAVAQKPDVAEGHYFVGFKTNVGPNDHASLRAQGLHVGKTFPEVQAVEIVARNANQLAALQKNPRVEYVEEVPMRYPVSLSSSQLAPNVGNGLWGPDQRESNRRA